jgi:hypothetical protein
MTRGEVKSSRCFRFCVAAHKNERLTTHLPPQAARVPQLATSDQPPADMSISFASVTDAVNMDNMASAVNHAGWDVSSINSAEVRGSRSS